MASYTPEGEYMATKRPKGAGRVVAGYLMMHIGGIRGIGLELNPRLLETG